MSAPAGSSLDGVQARSAPRRPPARRCSAAGKPVVVSGLARDVQAPLLQKLAANGTWVPSVKVAARRRRLVRRHRAAEGHCDLSAHRRRPGRPCTDDHRARGTGEMIARAATLVAAVVLSLVGGGDGRGGPVRGRNCADRRPRRARGSSSKRVERPASSTSPRSTAFTVTVDRACRTARRCRACVTSSRSAAGGRRTSPTIRSCRSSGTPPRIVRSMRGPSNRRSQR